MKKFTYLALIIIPFLFSSCSSGKKVASGKNEDKQQNARLVDDEAVQREFVNAMKAKILEDYEQAIKSFEKCIRLDPDNDAAMYELANIHFVRGEYDLALEYSREAVELNEKNKWYMMLYAEVLSFKGRFADAADVYEKLIENNPKELEFYFDQAFMLIKAEKYEEAIKVYDEYENIVGLDENVIVQKQRLYVRLGKIEKAADELRKLVEAFPDEPKYYKMLADLYEANDMNDKASKIYEELLKIDEDNPNALLYLADLYRTKGEHEKSMEFLKKAFKNPDLGIDAKVRILFPYLQKMLQADDGRKEEAFSLAQLVIEAHPNEAKAHAIYADLLYQDKQLEEALAQYEQALDLDSSVFEIWQQIFFIDSELRRNEDLEEVTESALELFPNQPIVYFFNGSAKNQLKKYKAAIEILNLGEPLVIDNPLLKAQFNATLGDAYNSIEEYAKSDSSFEKALKLDPDNSYVLNNYSYYLSLREENLEKAKDMSARANEMESKNSAFEDTYAWILYKLEEYEEAKVWIEKSMENGGDDSPVILEHYGDILYQLGEVDKAVIYWQKAQSLGSDSELIGKKIADKKIYE